MQIQNVLLRRVLRCLLVSAAAVVGLTIPVRAQVTDTLTREVSVWNNPNAVTSNHVDAIAREVSAWNNPQAFAVPVDAIAREVSAWNNPQAFAVPVDAIAREVSTWNNPQAFASPVDALTREVSVQVGAADPFANARKALAIAGGRTQANGADMTALNLVTTAPSNGKIDLLDAVRLARKATGLDP